ncbi:MAG TPA: hypothetical protein VMU02_12370, partial [bacterium]|nr:hypothetical protein [bacterium]
AFLALIAISVVAAAGFCQEWPRDFTTPEAQITMYEPQVQSYDGDNLTATAAVAIKTASMDSPVFGAVWIDARVSTDRETDTARLLDAQVTDARFPDSAAASARTLRGILERELPQWDLALSLEALRASADAGRNDQAASGNLENSPPRIIFVTYPAVLVSIDGDPKLERAENSDLLYVVNTPFFIVFDRSTGKYFLKGGQYWYESREVTGGWRVTDDVPGDVADLAARGKQPAEPRDSTLTGWDVAPVVIVATEPADLVVANGDPQFSPIEGTNLLYMTNTESDVIMDIKSQRYFVLLSGRWYTSDSLTGDRWTFVRSDQLPADFARIPADSEMGDVLASVAGTQQAKDALLDQQVPQTAEVDRKTADLDVAYDGDPDFERISGTDMSYAVNTDKDVLLIGGKYYCCDHAVWFASDQPAGPWSVCAAVPEDIYNIPPSCPVYNVRYVYVYGYTPDIVYVGYTPGYLWSFPEFGCIVYGTGYHYHGWYHHYYYPWPATFGFGVHYSPFFGWGFSFGLGYGWLGDGWPRPFYSGWWGPGGYRYGYRHGFYRGHHHSFDEPYFSHTHPGARAPFYDQTPRHFESSNVYRQRTSGVLRTGDFLGSQPHPATGRVVVSPGGKVPVRHLEALPGRGGEVSRGGMPEARSSAGGEVGPGSEPRNNVYIGRDGTVYRRTTQGWQMRHGNRWMPADRSPSRTVRQTYESNSQELRRQMDSRQREADMKARLQDWQSRARGEQAPPQQFQRGASGRSRATSGAPHSRGSGESRQKSRR